MLSLFRKRPDAKPHLIAPLAEASWDGHMLALRFSGEIEELALDVDGRFFTVAAIGSDGSACVAFPFSPSGNVDLRFVVRRGRDGESLTPTPLDAQLHVPGFRPTATAASVALPLAPPIEASRLVDPHASPAAHDVAIVIPVYNASAAVARCLESVVAHTTGRASLIVIDDASTDMAIAPLLARYANRPSIEVLANAQNLGFTATVNRGMTHAGRADIVLLNADTVVGPNWLTGLRRAAYAGDDIATATAVSNNAGAFSVPELERANELPADWTFDQSARALWQGSGLAYPMLPTGNGFCLYIRRDVLDRVGLFDADAFPQGYGEENDFCQRAAALGYRHAIAGNVFVAHERSQSFGDERRIALGHAGMAVLRERYPNYEHDVGATLFSFERRVLDWRVRQSFATTNVAPRARALSVSAGALATDSVELWQLRVATGAIALLRDDLVVARHTMVDAHSSARAVAEWIQLYAFEAIASDASIGVEIANVAASLGVPCVEIARGDSLDRVLADAWHTTRSFREGPR